LQELSRDLGKIWLAPLGKRRERFTRYQGTSPKPRKIEMSFQSGVMIFGKRSEPSRRSPVFPRSMPSS
jgi:hypothetical protein